MHLSAPDKQSLGPHKVLNPHSNSAKMPCTTTGTPSTIVRQTANLGASGSQCHVTLTAGCSGACISSPHHTATSNYQSTSAALMQYQGSTVLVQQRIKTYTQPQAATLCGSSPHNVHRTKPVLCNMEWANVATHLV